MEKGRRIVLEETPGVPDTPVPVARVVLEPEPVQQESLRSEQTSGARDAGMGAMPRMRALHVGVCLGAVLLLLHTLDALVTLLRASPALGVAWSVVFALVASGAGRALFRMWQRLRRARGHDIRRERVRYLLAHDGLTEARTLCANIARDAGIETSPAYLRWQRQLADTHNDREVLQLYGRTVLVEADTRALARVSAHAGDVAVMVAVSYFPAVDMLLVLWRQLKLIEDVCAEYGVDPGYWGRIRLLRKVLRNMALAGAAEVATEVGVEALGAGLTAKLSGAAAQGVAAGVLTARLGLRAMEACRAVPWEEGERPRLRQVTEGVLASAKRYLADTPAGD